MLVPGLIVRTKIVGLSALSQRISLILSTINNPTYMDSGGANYNNIQPFSHHSMGRSMSVTLGPGLTAPAQINMPIGTQWWCIAFPKAISPGTETVQFFVYVSPDGNYQSATMVFGPFTFGSVIGGTYRYVAVERNYNQANAAAETYDRVESMPFAAFAAQTGAIGIPFWPTTSLPTAELPTTAAFTGTGGTKLATLTSITPTLDSTGAGGTVTLYSQHYNDALGAWASLGDVIGGWTSHGAVVSGTPIDLSATKCRTGEKYRWKAEFTSTDGTLPPPKLSGLSLAWVSDITAPGVPTIAQIFGAVPAGGVNPGYRADFTVPVDARHVVIEGQRNSGGYLPFSTRAKFENGQGSMAFVGDLAQIEAAGERNETHLSSMKGFAVGDTVQIRAQAQDAVGNVSTWVESPIVALAIDYPAPTITSTLPVNGNVIGGTTVNIIGTGFRTGLSVLFDGSSIAYTFVSSTELQITTPFHSEGALTIQVVNPDGKIASVGFHVGDAEFEEPITGSLVTNILPTASIFSINNDDVAGLRIRIVNSTDPSFYYTIVEIKKNDEDYTPLSKKGNIEYGYNYMHIRNSPDNRQQADCLNKSDFIITDVVIGDSVRLRAKSVATNGDYTDWVETIPIEITDAAYIPYEVEEVSVEMYNDEEIVVEIE